MDHLSKAPDSLSHYGILGMRWGKKKNTDASESEDHKKASAIKKKKLKDMTNEELKVLTTRLQLERQYRDLSKHQLSSGKKIVTNLLKDVGREYVRSSIKSGSKAFFELLKKK